MSNDHAHLALRFEGPLQAWGFSSQFNRRGTGLFPTKSAILGVCCAALGIARGSDDEAGALARMRTLRLLVVAIPRPNPLGGEKSEPLRVRRIVDYHTVEKTRTAEGKIKDTHLTWREYLCDAAFVVVLAGERRLVEDVAVGLHNPKWGIWLGRKCCIPSAPMFVGVYETEDDALRDLLGGLPLVQYSHQREVDRFDDGTDTLPDQPLCFGGSSLSRSFSPRRVKLEEATV